MRSSPPPKCSSPRPPEAIDRLDAHAVLIGVSAATLRNWEQGRTYPVGAARALLKVAAKRPELVLDALRSELFLPPLAAS